MFACARTRSQRTRTIAALMEDWSLQRFTVTKCETEHGYHIPITPDFLAAHGSWTHRDTHAVRVRATPPAPTANLQEARHAIAVADQAEAGRYAPHELSAARANLAAANSAVSAARMVTAQRLADESTADAELATARTADVTANSVNREMKRSTATLIEEMQRSSGDPQ